MTGTGEGRIASHTEITEDLLQLSTALSPYRPPDKKPHSSLANRFRFVLVGFRRPAKVTGLEKLRL